MTSEEYIDPTTIAELWEEYFDMAHIGVFGMDDKDFTADKKLTTSKLQEIQRDKIAFYMALTEFMPMLKILLDANLASIPTPIKNQLDAWVEELNEQWKFFKNMDFKKDND